MLDDVNYLGFDRIKSGEGASTKAAFDEGQLGLCATCSRRTPDDTLIVMVMHIP